MNVTGRVQRICREGAMRLLRLKRPACQVAAHKESLLAFGLAVCLLLSGAVRAEEIPGNSAEIETAAAEDEPESVM